MTYCCCGREAASKATPKAAARRIGFGEVSCGEVEADIAGRACASAACAGPSGTAGSGASSGAPRDGSACHTARTCASARACTCATGCNNNSTSCAHGCAICVVILRGEVRPVAVVGSNESRMWRWLLFPAPVQVQRVLFRTRRGVVQFLENRLDGASGPRLGHLAAGLAVAAKPKSVERRRSHDGDSDAAVPTPGGQIRAESISYFPVVCVAGPEARPVKEGSSILRTQGNGDGKIAEVLVDAD